jgi:hypothetical protein
MMGIHFLAAKSMIARNLVLKAVASPAKLLMILSFLQKIRKLRRDTEVGTCR